MRYPVGRAIDVPMRFGTLRLFPRRGRENPVLSPEAGGVSQCENAHLRDAALDSLTGHTAPSHAALQNGSVEILSRSELRDFPRWAEAFAMQRKDRRYYEIVEDTICPDFDYGYFAIKDENGEVRAIQPFFVLDQDLLAGTNHGIKRLADAVRRLWPRFMRARTLMVGCAAGEGHLDGLRSTQNSCAQLLSSTIVGHARDLNASLVVLKEFPAGYRASLECFLHSGFARIASFPMVSLDLQYASFEDYMSKALSKKRRYQLRHIFATAARRGCIRLEIVSDVSAVIDDIYPLYLQVYERAKYRFEKLTREYFCALGQTMPDKTRFFVWRESGRVIAFQTCMVHNHDLYSEYIGLDYTVALDLHLYYYIFRDVVTWAMANGYERYHSSGLNYDPKSHLRFVLEPLDLYVRHRSWIINALLKRALALLEPARHDRTLRRFPNYRELWGKSPQSGLRSD